ncbi:MAG: type II toxin-antitoxin system RelE/ParE family toxin [Candidatus Bathyarchaeota archaeon]|nr:type II toxin-antitoxin system RelE/ParE family toxin [Candidatus Bathyarchaeota archaeon]
MTSYEVKIHRRVLKFLDTLNETQRNSVVEVIEALERYPVSLREMDVVTLRGLDNAYRVRLGRFRLLFYVEKDERVIYVTHLDSRKRVYKRSD